MNMSGKIEQLMAKMKKRPGAGEAALRDLTEKSWVPLPKEYLDLLRMSNGGEGWVGSSYLGLWPAEDIIKINNEYGVPEFHPGTLFFASNMGGVAYAFDSSEDKTSIVEVPFDSIDPRDVIHRGDTIEEFLQFLVTQWPEKE
jgi:SMI1 / KNR4 family (SUKH-1)